MSRNPGRLYFGASVAGVFLAAHFAHAPFPIAPAIAVVTGGEPEVALAAATTVMPTPSRAEMIDIAKRDPTELAQLGRARYERDVRDYSCVFLKQELIDGDLTPLQKIQVLYRESPTSVYMTWLENPDQAKRVLYVKGQNVGDNGEEQAIVEPAGAVIRLFVSDTLVPIRGSLSKKASRRAIDEFGFRSTMDLYFRFNEIAARNGTLDLKYAGEGTIDGRPTFMIERHLPFNPKTNDFPDAKMVMHLDQEWLLPVAVYSYADDAGKKLLGSYVFTQVRINPGLSDDVFKF